jgi:ankyrin repeat protein
VFAQKRNKKQKQKQKPTATDRPIDQPTGQLCSAAGSGDAARVQTCLLKGAQVNRADYDRRTALHIACSDGHAEVVAALLKVRYR